MGAGTAPQHTPACTHHFAAVPTTDETLSGMIRIGPYGGAIIPDKTGGIATRCRTKLPACEVDGEIEKGEDKKRSTAIPQQAKLFPSGRYAAAEEQ